MIAAQAVKLGLDVLKPMAEHGRYDLAFDLGIQIVRVQCKWGALDRDRGVICVQVGGSRHTPGGYVLSNYTPDEVDAIGVYCGELDQVFLISIEVAAGRRQLHLRLSPPRNGQRAALNWAAHYKLPGAIAQLGERLSGTQKVAGSSPASSTSSGDSGIVVGAHSFRNQFGYWMERAAAGDEIIVTRRGRPTVRLTAHQPELPGSS